MKCCSSPSSVVITGLGINSEVRALPVPSVLLFPVSCQPTHTVLSLLGYNYNLQVMRTTAAAFIPSTYLGLRGIIMKASLRKCGAASTERGLYWVGVKWPGRDGAIREGSRPGKLIACEVA